LSHFPHQGEDKFLQRQHMKLHARKGQDIVDDVSC
jgi:hypothetical protein